MHFSGESGRELLKPLTHPGLRALAWPGLEDKVQLIAEGEGGTVVSFPNLHCLRKPSHPTLSPHLLPIVT